MPNRTRHLRSMYGITEEHYEWLLAKQGGVCAICKSRLSRHIHSKLNVDHCHKTKAVRGLLCASCNLGLGKFRDDPEILKAALAYLTNVGLNSEMKAANIPLPKIGKKGWPNREFPDQGHKIRRQTAEMIRKLRKQHPKVCTQQWLADKFKVSQALVSAILLDKVWKKSASRDDSFRV